MKKIFTLFISVLFALFPFSGCKTEKTGVLRINEVTDSFFYAPFYVAIEKGFFKEEGLEIELTNGGGSDVSMTALISGNADIILAGPETAVYVNRQHRNDAPKVFAQLTKRDGCFLISKNEEPNFSWDNLKNKEIIIGRKGGLPAMTFEYITSKLGYKNGVDITLRTDIQFNLMAPTFETSSADYVTLFEPTATEFVKAKKGYIVASVGAQSGEIPYTSFIALESFMKKHPEKIEKFVTALFKALKFIKEESEIEVAKYLVKHFTGNEINSVAESLKNYKSVDTWASDLALSESMFTKLLDVLNNAGESAGDVTHSDIVTNEFVNKVYKNFNQ